MGWPKAWSVPVPTGDALFTVNGYTVKSAQLPASDFIFERENMNWKGCYKMIIADVRTSFTACVPRPAWCFGLLSSKGFSLIFSFSWTQAVSDPGHECPLFRLGPVYAEMVRIVELGYEMCATWAMPAVLGGHFLPVPRQLCKGCLMIFPGCRQSSKPQWLKTTNLILVC